MDEEDAVALSGDEQEEDMRSARAAALGYAPQKEAHINWVLPYSDQLDAESAQLLEDIKSHLGRAVMLREMKPACGVWTSRLIKYLRVYGLKFSKDDHVALVKLVYQLMLIPDLEPTKLHKFATLFIMLTKRRYLLSPEELTLQWRPLHDLLVKINTGSYIHYGMVHYMSLDPDPESGMLRRVHEFSGSIYNEETLSKLDSLGTTCELAVRCAQPYFELSATKEILEEIMPAIVPWSQDSRDTLDRLVFFLPMGLRSELAEHGHKLWLDDMMTLWKTCSNPHSGTGDVFLLISVLAKRNPGEVDWSPHVPYMFTRFMHSFSLPVSYKDTQPLRAHPLDTKHMATWIVWGMSHDGVMLQHLRCFLAGIESYLHSANCGRWSYKLRDFLRKLARAFLFRVYRERHAKFQKSWENSSPPSFRLRDQDIDEFVQVLLPSALLAVYSRYNGTDPGVTLQCLATLRPAVVIPPLLQRFYSTLESLTEPHRVTAAMQAISAVARPLVRSPMAGYPEGPAHVVPLLIASIPGLDPNDIRKTMVTLNLIITYGTMVPFIDCSAASEHWNDLTEDESVVCASTAQFEDFVLMFLSRLFVIIESTAFEGVRMESRDSESARSKHDVVLENGIAAAATIVIAQCSPSIFAEALCKFKAFATKATFEIHVSGRHIGLLLRAFVHADAKATHAAFIPHLCEQLSELLSTDEAIRDENPPRELLYYLLLLSNVVEENVQIFEYFPVLLPMLDKALKTHSREAYDLAGDTLSSLIHSFGHTFLQGVRSSKRDYGDAPKKWLPIREWGAGCHLKETDFDWHMPSDEDARQISELLHRYTLPEMDRLRAWLDGTKEISRERRHRALSIIDASLPCLLLMRPHEEPPVSQVESAIPATPFHLADGSCRTLEIRGVDVRKAFVDLCHDIQLRMLEDKSDDTRSLDCLINIWESLCMEGRSARECNPLAFWDAGCIDGRIRLLSSVERFLDGRGGPKPGCARLRFVWSEAAALQHQVRIDLCSDAGLGETPLKIMHALLDLSVYTYAEVRVAAQRRLQWMLSHHAYSCRALLPRLCELLRPPPDALTEEEAHSRLKGMLYLICSVRSTPLAAKQDWEVVHTLWPAVLRAPLSEKPSIIRLEQLFADTVTRHFPTVNTRLELTAGCVDAAKVIVPAVHLTDEGFASALRDAEVREKAASDETERFYLELMEELVSIAEDPSTMWRRGLIAGSLIAMSTSLQTPYPASAVRLIVNTLLHDNILARKYAVKMTLFALKQTKQKHKKIKVDPFVVAGVERPQKIIPGYREDNKWAMYSKERIPTTDEEWDQPYLQSNIGFYTWPDKIEVYAPSSEQPNPERPVEEMTASQREIYKFFNNDDNVEKLVGFLSAEDKKGKDKFNGFRFSMFKSLFRAYGEPICRKFLAHALKHAGETHEASQRFAAEIASAALKGTKHWTRSKAMGIYDDVIEIFRIGLSSVTPESSDDWGTCLATASENLEPHRAAPVLHAWMEMCIPRPAEGEDADARADSSFGMSARLYALQGALGALSWRGAPLCAEFVRRLQDARFIQHPYQNVRERVGSILMTAFDLDVVFPGGVPGPAPLYADFLADTWPRLSALYDQHGEIIVQTRAAWVPTARCDTTATIVVPKSALSSRADLPEVVVSSGHLGKSPVRKKRNDTEEGEASGSAVVGCARAERELASRLDGGLRLCGEGEAEEGGATQHAEHARAINLLTTLLRGTVGAILRGARGLCASHYELLHASCALSARGTPQSHDELARAADAYLACIALAHHDQPLFDLALSQVERVCGSRSWWARLSAVEFSQSLMFYSLPLLRAEPERAARAEAIAVRNMRDTRLEVRVAASKLLTGLMHCSALPNETKTLNQLMKCCRSKQLIERHCGVLGLCAYVSSRPYTIPPRLGEILAELLRHTNAPDPLPTTINGALADFKRTHQDDWQTHREALSQEELDLLVDLAAPPPYFA